MRAVACAAVILGLLLLSVPSAQGFGESVDGGARSDPDGVTVRIRRWGGNEEATVGGSSGSSRCQATRVRGIQSTRGITLPSGPDDSLLYLIRCPGGALQLRWVDPTDIQDVDAEARRVAQEYLERIPVPDITVHANPTEGITGIETWLWASGYDGEPITETVEAFGIPVEVEIESGSVTWDFGDATPPVQGDLGRPYPQRSTVTHVYTHRSTHQAAPDQAYAVTATLALVPRYRVAGGPWETLPGIRTTDSQPYLVREVQALIR